MDLVVQKYGGTSVANTKKIKNIARNIQKLRKRKKSLVVVVSAMAGETDKLHNLTKDISKIPNDRECDQIISTGEKVSAGLVTMALLEIGIKAISLDPRNFGLITNDLHGKATILSVGTDEIKKYLKKGFVVVIPGFQGINLQGDVTTLGRGGSDLSAVAIASALKASY